MHLHPPPARPHSGVHQIMLAILHHIMRPRLYRVGGAMGKFCWTWLLWGSTNYHHKDAARALPAAQIFGGGGGGENIIRRGNKWKKFTILFCFDFEMYLVNGTSISPLCRKFWGNEHSVYYRQDTIKLFENNIVNIDVGIKHIEISWQRQLFSIQRRYMYLWT